MALSFAWQSGDLMTVLSQRVLERLRRPLGRREHQLTAQVRHVHLFPACTPAIHGISPHRRSTDVQWRRCLALRYGYGIATVNQAIATEADSLLLWFSQVMQGVALVAAAVAGGTAWRAMKRWRNVETLADLKR